MTDHKIPMTQEAYDLLKEELNYLEGEARTKIIDMIGTARAHGDLSENAEYHAAKDQQGLQEARVRQLRDMLENAEIVAADDDSVVKPGKIVTIKHDDDEPETYLLGLREEGGGDYDVLTLDSPMGRALVGHGVGEVVIAKVPNGTSKVEIVEVRSR